jgi:alpha-tubulin suppressor-like RCC1 family protein
MSGSTEHQILPEHRASAPSTLIIGYGSIGCGNYSSQSIPIKINGFENEKIISIACGGYHSLVLSNTGKVYSWGSNSCDQLGIGNQTNQNIPQKLNLNNNQIFNSISCGSYHSLLLTADGDIYAFGWVKLEMEAKLINHFQ